MCSTPHPPLRARARHAGPRLAAVLALAAACGGSEGGAEGGTGSTSAATSSSTSTTGTSSPGSDTGTASGSDTGTAGGTTGGATAPPEVLLPRAGLTPDELAIVVNDDDPDSVALAETYRQARQIPPANVVHVSFPVQAVAGVDTFAAAKAEVDALPDTIQGLVLAWTQPYRVDCQSMVSAFTLGYDVAYCGGMGGCGMTPSSPYFDHATTAPFTDLGIRPTMMLAGTSQAAVEVTIANGIAADGTLPFGDGYLIRTTDGARSVRWPVFEQTVALFDHDGGLALTYIDNADGSGSNVIANTTDVMFVFTGLANVPDIETNTYLPGAMADHLTSFGGQVPTAGNQMSAAKWLEAGVTASYGSVTEPCNFVEKFPNTKVALSHYFRGATVLEAYWKSVKWPGQGNFVGEPLASPYRNTRVDWDPATKLLTIQTTLLEPGADYAVESAPAADGPWTEVLTGSVPYPVDVLLEVPGATEPFYRLRKLP